MKRHLAHNIPAVIGAAVLLSGGTGAAAYALVGNTVPSPAQGGNSQPIDDNHATVASPAPVDDRGVHATPEAAEVGDDKGVHASAEPGDDRGGDRGAVAPTSTQPSAVATQQSDDHGGSPDSGSGSGSDDSGSGDSGRTSDGGGSSGGGSDDGGHHS